MRVWRQLREWVEQESQSARIYRRLADTAALHQEGKAGLYHDPDLQIASSWRESTNPSEAWAARYTRTLTRQLPFWMQAAKRALRPRNSVRPLVSGKSKRLASWPTPNASEQRPLANRRGVCGDGGRIGIGGNFGRCRFACRVQLLAGGRKCQAGGE